MFNSTSTYQRNASFFLKGYQQESQKPSKKILDAYRFGFNGQEKDNELKGKGNVNTAEFWEYDTRFGRRWNLDRVIKPDLSGYLTFSDNPIIKVDPDGNDDLFPNAYNKAKTALASLKTAYGVFKTTMTVVNEVANKVQGYQRKLDDIINNKNSTPKEISGALFMEFLTGLGPEDREFDENHTFTKSLMESRETRIALENWYIAHRDAKDGSRREPESYMVNFPDINGDFPYLHVNETGPIRELVEDGKYTTAQFTGTAIYNFAYDKENQKLTVEVYDDKTVRSLLLHLTDDKHERKDNPIMGKTVQHYKFTLDMKDIKKMITADDKEKPRGEPREKKKVTNSTGKDK